MVLEQKRSQHERKQAKMQCLRKRLQKLPAISGGLKSDIVETSEEHML